MSGGSYGYLYEKLSESGDLRDTITAMAKRLEDSGYREPAAATWELLRLADSLAEVWQTVEWVDSNDNEESQAAEAVARFRACLAADSRPEAGRGGPDEPGQMADWPTSPRVKLRAYLGSRPGNVVTIAAAAAALGEPESAVAAALPVLAESLDSRTLTRSQDGWVYWPPGTAD